MGFGGNFKPGMQPGAMSRVGGNSLDRQIGTRISEKYQGPVPGFAQEETSREQWKTNCLPQTLPSYNGRLKRGK